MSGPTVQGGKTKKLDTGALKLAKAVETAKTVKKTAKGIVLKAKKTAKKVRDSAMTPVKVGATARHTASLPPAAASKLHSYAEIATPNDDAPDYRASKRGDLTRGQARVNELLGPGAKLLTAKGAIWSDQELDDLIAVLEGMPAGDRAALAQATFVNTKELPPSHDGHSNAGLTEFHSGQRGGPLTISLSDGASEIAGGFRKVVAHEVGHAVQGGGKWDANAVREFAKLSHWVEKGPPEVLVDGYNEIRLGLNHEIAYPKNKDNFVSQYAQESAVEDYAESYRHYLLAPEVLMKKAPDKFLYLNAQSGKYPPGEVRKLAGRTNIDLDLTMATLRQSNLRTETVDRIIQKNNLPDAGPGGSAAGNAIALIQEKGQDVAFAELLRRDAKKALGAGIWERLTGAEQRLLSDGAYVDKLLAATAANRASPADNVTTGEVEAWKDFFRDLVNNPPKPWQKIKMLFSGKARDEYVNKILGRYSPRFSQETRDLLGSPMGKEMLKKMVRAPGAMTLMEGLWGGLFGRNEKWVKNVNSLIDRTGAAEVQYTLDLARKGALERNVEGFVTETTKAAELGYYGHTPGDDLAL